MELSLEEIEKITGVDLKTGKAFDTVMPEGHPDEPDDLYGREGPDFRAGGGLIAYRQDGGDVAPLPGAVPTNTEKFLGQDVRKGAIGRLGAGLVAIGQRDFSGASAALAAPLEGDDDENPDLTRQMLTALRKANPHLS